MPSGTLEKVLARLAEMGYTVSQYGGEYRSQCPAHRGNRQSLAFSVTQDGRFLATCHSKKCSFEEIINALGLTPGEVSPRTPPPKSAAVEKGPRGKKIHRTFQAALGAAAFGIHKDLKRKPDFVYPYHNPDGTENLFACRWELTPEEQKQLDLSQRKVIRYVSAYRGGYIVGTEPGRLYPIYRIDELWRQLRDAKESPFRIYVCEGEKAAEKARSLGLVAVCTPFGSESAVKADWSLLDRLAAETGRSLEMILLPDNDPAGETYAQALIAVFAKFESKPVIKMVPFPLFEPMIGGVKFPEKGDICELAELLDSKTADEIRALIEQTADTTQAVTIEELPILEVTPLRELECVCDEAVEPKEIQFAWKKWLPYGKLILINGMGSVGKTSLLCSLMATMTAGALWPDSQRAERGCVVYFTSEDGIQDTISRRFRAHGGYSPNMFYYQQVHNNLDQTDEEFVLQEVKLLEKLIEKIERRRGVVRMVVFDPITAFTGKIDENKNNQVRSILGPLMKLTEAKNFVCIGVIHPKKGAMFSGTAAESVAGSSGYVNTARRVYQVFYDKENALRYMLVAKNNLGKDPPGIAFIIDDDGLVSFTDTNVDMDADTYLDRQREKFLRPHSTSKRGNIDDVEEWLTEFLSAGRMPSGQYGSGDESTVFGAGEKKGFSKKLIYQAKKNLGIEARKGKNENDTWNWSLPLDNMTAEVQDDFKKYASGDF